MQTTLRYTSAVIALTLCAACGGAQRTSAGTITQPSFAAPVPPPPTFPPLSGASRTFVYDHPASTAERLSEYTTHSRLVLYDDGGFVLQYPTLSASDGYRGGYTDSNGTVTFRWEGWSIAGPWGATGTLVGDSLTIRYNEVMQLTDFEDAVYVRVP
jgi:hypothetical protein